MFFQFSLFSWRWLSLFLLINAVIISSSKPQHKQCKGILVNSTDVSPTVQSNSTVTMTVVFNCTHKPHPVVWYSTAVDQYSDVTNQLVTVSSDGRYTSYETTFVIQHLKDDNQGRYTLLVCGESLQYFFVSFDDPGCGDQSPPAATYSAPTSHYIGPVAINYTMHCLFKGDTSSFDSEVEWNCINENITESKPGYQLTKSDHKPCSFIASLTLVHTSTSNSGIYECYAVTIDGTVGTKRSFKNVFLEYPSVLREPQLNSSHIYRLTDPLELSWRVSGTYEWNIQYIQPMLSINDDYYNTTTQCNDCQFYFKQDTLLSSYSYLVFKVRSISQLTSHSNASHSNTSLRIQVYLKFQSFVKDVSNYNNQIANHSQITVITFKEVPPPGRPFPWYYVCSFGSVIIFVFGVIFVIVVVTCVRRRRRNHREGNVYPCIIDETTPLNINDHRPPTRGQTPERGQTDRYPNDDHTPVVSPLPVVDDLISVHNDGPLIPSLITSHQETTCTDDLPEADKEQHRMVPYIRPSIAYPFRNEGATPLLDPSADTPLVSHDSILPPLNSHDYLKPFVSHDSGLDTPLSDNSPQTVAPPIGVSCHLTPERRGLEMVVPPTPYPPKRRVSASEEEEEIERDGPVYSSGRQGLERVVSPTLTGSEKKEEIERDGPVTIAIEPYKVFVLYCNTSTDGVRAESSSHQVFLFIQLLKLLSRNEAHPSSLYDSHYSYTCMGDVFLEPSQCAHITNWSVWTDTQIRQATRVIFVCSQSLFNALQQPTGTTFEMHRGPVSSDMIYNMFTDRENGCKFIPIFLNSPLRSDYVPTPLRTRRCYTIRLENIFRNFNLLNLSSEDACQIGDYLETHYHEMSDFLDLVRLLKNKEWE